MASFVVRTSLCVQDIDWVRQRIRQQGPKGVVVVIWYLNVLGYLSALPEQVHRPLTWVVYLCLADLAGVLLAAVLRVLRRFLRRVVPGNIKVQFGWV